MITIIHTKDKKYLLVDDQFYSERFVPVPKEDINTDEILYQTDLNGKVVWQQPHPERKIIEKYLYKYIARDKDGDLYMFKYKPHKDKREWKYCYPDFNGHENITYLSDMYPHVMWEDDEPYENPHYQTKTSDQKEDKN